MKKRICCLLVLLALCALPALAQDIGEKGTVTPTPAPTASRNVIIISRSTTSPAVTPAVTPSPAPTAKAAGGNVVIVNSHASKSAQAAAAVTAAPTAAPILAADADNCLQDPIAFGEGAVRFYSNDDNAYCKRSNYEVTSGSAVEFAKAYADMCKSNPYMTYLEFTTAPSGWSYYCFAAADDKNYTPFTTSSGDWSTGNLCFSISFKESSPYITLRWSFELEMCDLGYRRSAAAAPATIGSVATQVNIAAASLEERKQIWLSDNQYYYAQLSEAHKKAWDIDIANVLNYPNQTASSTRDVRNQALASMIQADNPRIFWIDWIDSYGRLRYETGSVATYAALQYPQGETLASLQETFLAAIPKAVAAIEKTLPAQPTAEDKARAIHDWLCKNNTYNEKQTSSHKAESDPVAFAYLAAHSAFSAMIPGDAYEPVCEGYASAFKILCEEFGVESLIVHGKKNTSGHTWNYVKLDDGNWYLVDVDADDLAASHNHSHFLLNNTKSTKNGYAPNPYLTSGVNPGNGYSEGASFTLPDLAD